MSCSNAQARIDILERLVAAVQALRLLSVSAKPITAEGKFEDGKDNSGKVMHACTSSEALLVLSLECEHPLCVSLVAECIEASVSPDVAEVSQQLCKIACLLEVNSDGELARPLLSAANERLPRILQTLPESFFSPLLPQGCLSTEQVGMRFTGHNCSDCSYIFSLDGGPRAMPLITV